MSALPAWNSAAFGCLLRDAAHFRSLLRTALTADVPVPMVSRKADTSAPVEFSFGLDVDDAGLAAWVQWYEFDLADGSLPFVLPIPWGTVVAQTHARLVGGWTATRIDSFRWSIGATAQIERASLPRFSGGAYA